MGCNARWSRHKMKTYHKILKRNKCFVHPRELGEKQRKINWKRSIDIKSNKQKRKRNKKKPTTKQTNTKAQDNKELKQTDW